MRGSANPPAVLAVIAEAASATAALDGQTIACGARRTLAGAFDSSGNPRRHASSGRICTALVAGAPCQVRLPRLVPVPPKPGTTGCGTALFWCVFGRWAAGVLSFMTGAVFVRRTLRSPWPLVDLRTFRDRNFTVGCLLSFVLGIGLFGSVYLMPVFLAYVRGHGAFEVGMIIWSPASCSSSPRRSRPRSSSAMTSVI